MSQTILTLRGHYRTTIAIALAVLLLSDASLISGQTSDPKAERAVEAAVQSELAAAAADRSNWTYRDHDVSASKDALYVEVETPQGSLKRMVELDRRPVTTEQRSQETDRIAQYVKDAAEQAKHRKAGDHDDDQASALIKMLPTAFIWTVAEETPQLLTLNYRPNPNFGPPNMEARVMGTMAGQMVVVRGSNRIRTLRGTLSGDVKIGFGILGKLNKGGTFDIERREVGPGFWEITETLVHIGGHALLFKTIGQQEDEIKTDWKPSPAHTLAEAEAFLRDVR